MRTARVSRWVLALGVSACVGVLALTPASSAMIAARDAIDPGTRVNDMLVVAGVAQRANASLFGYYCDPVVMSAGRRTRVCGARVPHVSRLFVGHGIFGPERTIEKSWNRTTWDLWIDGQHVDLVEFGTTDRWLFDYPPAGFQDVVLREWSIMLVGPQGRHTIRYRTRWPNGVIDTTWKFLVAPS